MSQYLPARTNVVATSGSVLVRGSILLHADGRPAFLDVVADAQRQTDIDLSNLPVCVVSLIDNQGELSLLNHEAKACGLVVGDDLPACWPPFTVGYKPEFQGRPRLLWWPVEAFGLDTPWETAVGQFITDKGVDGQPGGYDLDGLVRRLVTEMTTGPAKLIYVHCTLGADRTGAVIFGYLVRRGLAPTAALSTVESVTTPNSDYLRLIAAYQKFLHL